MTVTDSILEKAEDGAAVTPTPTEKLPVDSGGEGASAAPAVEARNGGTETAVEAGAAPVQSRAAAERAIYDDLLKKSQGQADSSAETDRPSPSATPEQKKTIEPDPEPAESQDKTADPKPIKGSPRLGDYDGTIDKESLTALNRVGWVIPVADWKDRSVEERADVVRAAKRLRASIDADFQKNKQESEKVGIVQETGQTNRQPGATAERVSGQGTPSETAKPKAEQGAGQSLPNEFDSEFAAIEKDYGPELAESLKKIVAKVSAPKQSTEVLDAIAKAQAAEQAANDSRITVIETSVLDKLADSFPALADAKVRESVKKDAASYASAMWSGTAVPIEQRIREAIPFVVRGRFHEELKAQEKQKREAAKERSLNGTMERGVSRPGTTAGRTKADEERAMFNALQSQHEKGVTGRAAVEAAIRSLR